MSNNLTDRSFWQEYWKNYRYEKVPEKSNFDSYYPKKLKNMQGKLSIEIGGFPGIMSIFFLKKYGLIPSLLDFYIDMDIVRKMEDLNSVEKNTITCIESDFFKFKTDKLYDFVFSIGFIEHFDDTEDVIKRHVNLLASEGILFIALPNFLGINGWIQKTFDRKNYEAHNLNSMKISNLKNIMDCMGLKNVKIEYTRKPIIWLEPKPSLKNKIARKFIRMFSYILKIFPIKGRFLSPYIVISAQK